MDWWLEEGAGVDNAEAGREKGFSCLLTSSISALISHWMGLDISRRQR